MKKKYNLIYGIAFVLINLFAKFLIFGNKEIWFNNMPPAVYYYGFNDFLQVSIQISIPFIIIGGLLTILYEIISYRKKCLIKKVMLLFQ